MARRRGAGNLSIGGVVTSTSQGVKAMSKSPGHQKMPDHKVNEEQLGQNMTVEIDGEIIADSSDVIRVDEDKAPARYYFPRSDVKMAKLERTATTTECPFKGT